MCFAVVPEADVRPAPPTTPARRYVPELDGLRAIAALLVVLFHCNRNGPFSGGFIGVDMFFVLSAFLITSILAEEEVRTGTIRLGRFYWRRTVRLLPALLLFLTAYVVIAPLVWPGYPHTRDALIAGFYVSNFAFVAAKIPTYISHTWSLAAEEQFYLLWPLTLLALLKSKRPVVWLALGWAALTLLRINTDYWIAYYYGLAPHGTGLLLGAILYFLIRDGKLALRPIHAAVAGAMLAILSVAAWMHLSSVVITVAEFSSAVIIGTIITNPGALRILASPLLVGLGKLSYGLYLWHFPISYFMRGAGNFGLSVAITFFLSLGMAALSYMTVEAWAKRLRAPVRPATELA